MTGALITHSNGLQILGSKSNYASGIITHKESSSDKLIIFSLIVFINNINFTQTTQRNIKKSFYITKKKLKGCKNEYVKFLRKISVYLCSLQSDRPREDLMKVFT